MDEITETQVEDIRRTVKVVFSEDKRPEFDRDGKHYRLTAAQMEFTLRKDGSWGNPWDITSARQQRVKDGSWGKEQWTAQWRERSLITALCDEYRPTAIITITETNNTEESTN